MTEREKLRKGLPFSQTVEKKQRFSRLFMPITASIVSLEITLLLITTPISWIALRSRSVLIP